MHCSQESWTYGPSTISNADDGRISIPPAQARAGGASGGRATIGVIGQRSTGGQLHRGACSLFPGEGATASPDETSVSQRLLGAS